MSAKHLIASSLLALGVLASSDAHAGEKRKLSELPALPAFKAPPSPLAPAEIPGVKITKSSAGTTTYVEASASTRAGYCFVQRLVGLELLGSVGLSADVDEMWRFAEKDGSATLERIVFDADVAADKLMVRGRTSIALRQVATMEGLAAWAFRDSDGSVVILARGGDSGRQSVSGKREEIDMMQFSSSSCAFGATRLDGRRAVVGATARLSGTLLGGGAAAPSNARAGAPGFVLDSSLAKTSRDPEPMLSVRLRRTTPSGS